MRPGVRLGVDVGSVRVGVARCDPSGLLATPVETVTRTTRSDHDLQRLVQLISDYEVMEVIVGLPVNLSGRPGPAAEAARQYADQIARRVHPVPVRMVDERLSTVTAQRSLRQAGVAGRKHRPVVDQAAAVVILQAALDAERASGRPPGALVTSGSTPDRPASGEQVREAGPP